MSRGCWAWGQNTLGQLGNGTTVNSLLPVRGYHDMNITPNIASGANQSLAITSDTTNLLWAWGQNTQGQLGDNTTTDSYIPTIVLNLKNIIAAAGGVHHSLAISVDGKAWAWGDNTYGQLGNNTTTSSNTAVQVSNLASAIAIASGAHYSLALRSDGTVWAWGINNFGQLGNGTTTNSSVPVQAVGLTGIIAIGGGSNHSLAVKSDGTVWAWGDNIYGQLGYDTSATPTPLYSATPAQVTTLANIISVAGGQYHSLALKSDGTVWAWGRNNVGQLGNGTTTDSTTPVQVSGLAGVKSVASCPGEANHSLALKFDGTVRAWGDNTSGQLGDGTTTSSTTPVQVSGIDDILAIACGANHSLALSEY